MRTRLKSKPKRDSIDRRTGASSGSPGRPSTSLMAGGGSRSPAPPPAADSGENVARVRGGHHLTKTEAKPDRRRDALFSQSPDGLREIVRAVMQELLEAEMTDAVGAEKGERTAARLGYRSGYYTRTLIRSAMSGRLAMCWVVCLLVPSPVS